MAFLAAAAPYAPQIVGGLGSYKESRVKPKKTPAIPMPDEEELQKAKRRSPGSRGRASTILTGTDYGLGG